MSGIGYSSKPKAAKDPGLEDWDDEEEYVKVSSKFDVRRTRLVKRNNPSCCIRKVKAAIWI